MTREEMEAEVGRLLTEERRLRRLGLSLPPDKRMLLARLLYRLGWTKMTRMSRRQAVLRYTVGENNPSPTGPSNNPSDPPESGGSSDPPTPLTPEAGHNGDSPAAEDWDGTIDEDEVLEDEERWRYGVAEWSRWTDDGDHMPQTMHIQSGLFTPPGRDTPVPVYRWVHHDHDGDHVDSGDWDLVPEDVERHARRYADRNNEDPPDPDDSDIPGSVPGEIWRRRRAIATYHLNGRDNEVRLDTGRFEFAGQDHDVYRWTTEHDADGDWTLNRSQAISDGEDYASENHEEPEDDQIHPYSYKPDYYPLGDKGPYYGAELETQLKQSSRLSLEEAAGKTLDLLNSGLSDEEFAYLKEDSSIESGSPHTGKGSFEIVTQPATLDVHRKQWAPFFADVPKGLISHDAQAGLHIHVGRDDLSKLGIGKMVYFINHPANKDFLTKLARRESPRWAELDPSKKVTDIRPGGRRYVALNLQPRETVEFRLFRGTLKPESFFAALEFVDALVNLTRPGMSGVKDMASPDALIRYVVAFHKDYPHLLNFVEKFAGQRFIKRGPRPTVPPSAASTPPTSPTTEGFGEGESEERSQMSRLQSARRRYAAYTGAVSSRRRTPVAMSARVRFWKTGDESVASNPRQMTRLPGRAVKLARPPKALPTRPILPKKSARVMGNNVVRKYAKVDGHEPAHPLISGFPIEHALRHLANDPKNDNNIRDTAYIALTGKNRNTGEVHPYGHTEALWLLNDALQEANHPLAKVYNWMSAADKIQLDGHTHTALTELANHTRSSHGSPASDTRWDYRPEGQATRVALGILGKSPIGVDQTVHRRNKEVLSWVKNRVKQLAPHADDKMIEESVRRHAHRSTMVWRREHGIPTDSDEGKSLEVPQVNEETKKLNTDLSSHAYKNEKATRYARLTIQPGEPLMGGADFMHEIHDESGQRVGHLWVSPQDDGTHLHVDHVGMMGHKPNAAGLRVIRQVREQLKQHYPNAKTIGGGRISGAVMKNTGEGRQSKRRPLSRRLPPKRYAVNALVPVGNRTPIPEYVSPSDSQGTTLADVLDNIHHWHARMILVYQQLAKEAHESGNSYSARIANEYEDEHRLYKAKTRHAMKEAGRPWPNWALDNEGEPVPYDEDFDLGERNVNLKTKRQPKGETPTENGPKSLMSRKLPPKRYALDIEATIKTGHKASMRQTQGGGFVQDHAAGKVLADALEEMGQPHAPFFRSLAHSGGAGGTNIQSDTGSYVQVSGQGHPHYLNVPLSSERWLFRPLLWGSDSEPAVLVHRGSFHEGFGPSYERSHTAVMTLPMLREWAKTTDSYSPDLTEGINQIANSLEEMIDKAPKGTWGQMSRRGSPKRYALSNRSDFLSALRRIRSSNQKAMHKTADQLAQQLGLHPVKVLDALHDTPHASVPGIAQAVYGNVRPEAIHAAAAWVGLTANLPGVAVFHPRPTGPDTLYRFRMEGSGMDARAKMDRFGLRSRILVPHRKGFDVLIPDKGNQLSDRIEGFADHHKISLEASPGHFSLIGDVDQARAREMFRGTVANQEHIRMTKIKNGEKPIRYSQKAFLDQLAANENDVTTRKVFADWLEENAPETTTQSVLDQLRNYEGRMWVGLSPKGKVNAIPRVSKEWLDGEIAKSVWGIPSGNVFHSTSRNSKGRAHSVRFSGKMKIWKTRPGEFRIPWKFGLYDNGEITHRNAHEWLTDDPTAEPT